MGTRVTGRRGLSTRRHVFGRRYVQGAEAAISATQQMRLKAQQGGRSCDAKKRADGGRLPSVGLRPPSASRPPSLSHLDCRWIPDLQKLTVRKARRRVSALHRSHRHLGQTLPKKLWLVTRLPRIALSATCRTLTSAGTHSYALTDESSCGSHATWRDRDHSRGSNNASACAGGNIHASRYQSVRLQRDRSERDLALL